MKITTDHPASRHGVPVVLGDSGEPMPAAEGLKAARRALGLSTTELASACGVSRRTVEDWEQGRWPVPAATLNVLRDALEREAPKP